MKPLEAEPVCCYIPAGLRAGTRVDVTISYKIGDVCTDSIWLGQTTLKADTPVWVVGLPNESGSRPTIYELDSPECEDLRKQGLYGQARETQTVLAREFIEKNPVLFAVARSVTISRVLKQPMELSDVTNVRLEVYRD